MVVGARAAVLGDLARELGDAPRERVARRVFGFELGAQVRLVRAEFGGLGGAPRERVSSRVLRLELGPQVRLVRAEFGGLGGAPRALLGELLLQRVDLVLDLRDLRNGRCS